MLALESFDEEAPVFIDDADMDDPNKVDTLDAPDAPEASETPEAPEAADWAPEPEGNFKPKLTYGASQPSNYTPELWRPVDFDSFNSPVSAPADIYTPTPTPADTYDSPLETPFSNEGAPSPTYTYRCAFCGIHEGKKSKKSKKCGKCDKTDVRFQSYISRKMTSYIWVGPYRIGQKTQRNLF